MILRLINIDINKRPVLSRLPKIIAGLRIVQFFEITSAVVLVVRTVDALF